MPCKWIRASTYLTTQSRSYLQLTNGPPSILHCEGKFSLMSNSNMMVPSSNFGWLESTVNHTMYIIMYAYQKFYQL